MESTAQERNGRPRFRDENWHGYWNGANSQKSNRTDVFSQDHHLRHRRSASSHELSYVRWHNNLASTLRRTKQENNSIKTENEHLNKKMSVLSREILSLEEKFKEVSIKFEISEHERLEGQKTLKQAEQRIEKLEPQLKTSLRENSELQSKVANLEDEVETLSKPIVN